MWFLNRTSSKFNGTKPYLSHMAILGVIWLHQVWHRQKITWNVLSVFLMWHTLLSPWPNARPALPSIPSMWHVWNTSVFLVVYLHIVSASMRWLLRRYELPMSHRYSSYIANFKLRNYINICWYNLDIPLINLIQCREIDICPISNHHFIWRPALRAVCDMRCRYLGLSSSLAFSLCCIPCLQCLTYVAYKGRRACKCAVAWHAFSAILAQSFPKMRVWLSRRNDLFQIKSDLVKGVILFFKLHPGACEYRQNNMFIHDLVQVKRIP